MVRLLILASGNGTNAENIIRYFSQACNSNIACVSAVLCNTPKAYALVRAKNFGIPALSFTRDQFNDPVFFTDLCRRFEADYIILAGFLWQIPPYLIAAFNGRIINIHPALLPLYGGKGMYGMRVHEAVVEAGEKQSGISIHIVDEHYDHGRIIFQATCPVEANDSAEDVAKKVHNLEYLYFPEVISNFIQDKL